MTSRQSAFFFLNSDSMMQNILEIDPLLLDSVFIGLKTRIKDREH